MPTTKLGPHTRPSLSEESTFVATHGDGGMIQLLGGESYHGVAFTSDQRGSFVEYYEFEDEGVQFHKGKGADTYELSFGIKELDIAKLSKALEGVEHTLTEVQCTVRVSRDTESCTLRNVSKGFGRENMIIIPSWEHLRKTKVEIQKLCQTVADRNMMRLVEIDGLRVMGLLAKFLEKGEDPVQLVARSLSEMGFDVPLEEEEE